MEFAEDVTLIVTMNELSDGWFEQVPGSMYRMWHGQLSAQSSRPWQLDVTYEQVTESISSYRSWSATQRQS